MWLLSVFAGWSCITFASGVTRGQAATFFSGPTPKSRDASACRAGIGQDHGAIFSSEDRVVVALPLVTISCAGRSNQSGAGGGGAAATARARGVSESRVVPGDRGLPGILVSVVESSSRARCSARMRTRPEPAKSTSG